MMVEFANGQLPWRKIKDKEQVGHSHCLLDSPSASLVIGAFYMVNLVFGAFCTVNLVFGVFYLVKGSNQTPGVIPYFYLIQT